jgi:hypothetical protein
MVAFRCAKEWKTPSILQTLKTCGTRILCMRESAFGSSALFG